MTREESEELVRGALAGDRSSLDAVVARYLPRLRAFVRLRTGAAIRAEESTSDLVQSVCRELLENLDGIEYRGEAAFRGWLFSSALHKILARKKYYERGKRDVARRATDGQEALAECYGSLTPSRALMQREQVEGLERAFDRLDEDQRRVIALVRIAGLSHAEAAEELGRTEGATRVLLHRALARLAVSMESA